MRLPAIVLLLLLCFSTTFAQDKPVVEDKGNFGLHVVDDRIVNHEYLERDNQLLLIGYRHLQLLDLTNFKVVETRPINLPSSRDLIPGYGQQDWTISPDGRHMVLIGLEEARTKTKTENKLAAFVFDLHTGKRIARLDRPDRILKATWSKNGKTLITMDAAGASSFTRTLNINFWDGETFPASD